MTNVFQMLKPPTSVEFGHFPSPAFSWPFAQEAHHLQSDGFHSSLIRDGITGDLEAEFTATFGGESSDDLDYLYSFQKAVPWRLLLTGWKKGYP